MAKPRAKKTTKPKAKPDEAPAPPIDSTAAAVWEALDALATWGRNPRVITQTDVDEAVASFLRWGFGDAMVGWTDNRTIYGGHARRLGVRKLLSGAVKAPDDWETKTALWTCEVDAKGFVKRDTFAFTGSPGVGYVPIRWCAFPSLAEAEAYGLRDNRPLGADDEQALAALVRELDVQEVTLAAIGFEADDLAALRALTADDEPPSDAGGRDETGAGDDADGGPHPGDMDAGSGVTRTAPLPVVKFGKHKLVCSKQDGADFEARIAAYVAAKGTTHGLVRRMIDAL